MLTVLSIAVVALIIVVIYLAVRLREAEKNIESLWQLAGKTPPVGSGRPLASILVVLVSAAAALGQSDQVAASVDRSHYPPEHQGYLYHLTTKTAKEGAERRNLETGLKLLMPTASPARTLESCLPVQVGPTTWRLDLIELQWDINAWYKILATYPYNHATDRSGRINPDKIRADWFLAVLSDATKSDAYYSLAFGGKKPKTRDEALKFYGVNLDTKYQLGIPEGKSGVNPTGRRLIRSFDGPRGWTYLTQDSRTLTTDKDPLEQVGLSDPHDGEEGIIYSLVVHRETHKQGVWPKYFLADGKGSIVNEAPADLVVDHQQFRGTPVIVAPGSCVGCHVRGPNLPTLNEFQEYLQRGVELPAEYHTRQAVEDFYGSDLKKDLDRTIEDYGAMCRLATGVLEVEAVDSFRSAFDVYRADVTLERAAYEYNSTPEEFTRALANASAYNIRLPTRIAGWPRDLAVPRDAVEQYACDIQYVLDQWRSQ